jgi:hypothetical protein
LFCQVLVTALFSVALLVLPVLLKLNYLPNWLLVFLVMPLYQYSVDAAGMGDCLSPNVLVSLSILGEQALPATFRLFGSILGGLVGGRIMLTYFPDDESVWKQQRE